MTKRVTEYARLDAAMAHAHLFRPLKRGEHNERLEFSVAWKDATLTFASAYQYGIPEQSIFLAACALCGLSGSMLTPSPASDDGKALRVALAAEKDATTQDAIFVETSLFDLLTAAGMATGGSAYRSARDMLWRLANLTVRVQRGGWDGSMRLLSFTTTPDNMVRIGLHHRLAAAIAGSAQHSRVNLIERRALNSDPAKALHAWASSFLRPGESKAIGLDKLAGHIWPHECSKAALSKRRARAREALEEIQALPGWTVSEANGLIAIGRPA